MEVLNDIRHTLLPFSIKTRSHTETSAANLLNSRTLDSKSEVHLLTISSRDLPFNMEGGWTETRAAALGAAVAIEER